MTRGLKRERLPRLALAAISDKLAESSDRLDERGARLP